MLDLIVMILSMRGSVDSGLGLINDFAEFKIFENIRRVGRKGSGGDCERLLDVGIEVVVEFFF